MKSFEVVNVLDCAKSFDWDILGGQFTQRAFFVDTDGIDLNVVGFWLNECLVVNFWPNMF